jgi:hypothetical protein
MIYNLSMDNNRITANSLESSLGSIFDTDEWTPLQHQSYTMIRHYVNNFKEKNKKYEIKDDKAIIRNNLKEQLWFTYSKSKPLISHLLDSMSVINYTFDDNDFCTNLMAIISFEIFKLHICFYKNKINDFLNYYIFFENDQKQKAYMAYYTISLGTEPTETVKKLKLPEFAKIYAVTGINSQMFYQYDLLTFFSEIVMYYDESGFLGDIQICFNVSVTLNELVNKFNNYVYQKNTDVGYKII